MTGVCSLRRRGGGGGRLTKVPSACCYTQKWKMANTQLKTAAVEWQDSCVLVTTCLLWASASIFPSQCSIALGVSLVPRPHPLTRKRVWWLLSTSLVVPSQQSWFLNKWTIISSWRCTISSASVNAVWCCAISLACSESRLLTRHNQDSAQWSMS